MKKSIIILASLIAFSAKAQTLIGINANVGNSDIIGKGRGIFSSLPGIGWGISAASHFNVSKRINPFLQFGFAQKGYLEILNVSYFDPNNTQSLIYETILTSVKQNNLHFDIGARCNILNKTHKIYIDAGMGNNFVISTQNNRKPNNFIGASEYETAASNPYYVSINLGVGYNYNNIFSMGVFSNIGVTNFDIIFYNKRINMFGFKLCYYLPILGNKKAKVAEDSK